MGARQADIILPSTSYVEKEGIYVNTFGNAQQGQKAVVPSGWAAPTSKPLNADLADGARTRRRSSQDARDDFEITKALSQTLLRDGDATTGPAPLGVFPLGHPSTCSQKVLWQGPNLLEEVAQSHIYSAFLLSSEAAPKHQQGRCRRPSGAEISRSNPR